MIDALGWIDSYQGPGLDPSSSRYGASSSCGSTSARCRASWRTRRGVDGAGRFRIFWSVALPLAKPAVATLALFAFIDAWKNFLWPLLVTRSMEMRVV